MSDLIKNVKATAWEWRMAAFWFALFSINALCTSITAALVGTDWPTLPAQGKFMIFIAVIGNWSGTIMAFISKQSNRIAKTGTILPGDDTAFITKTQTISQTDSVKTSTTPPAAASTTT